MKQKVATISVANAAIEAGVAQETIRKQMKNGILRKAGKSLIYKDRYYAEYCEKKREARKIVGNNSANRSE